MIEGLTAKRGWMAIGAVVAIHEIACAQGQTLSEGVDRAIEKHPLITTGAIGLVALHLVNALPEQYDPIHRLAHFRDSRSTV